jgi:hypothetical protein
MITRYSINNEAASFIDLRLHLVCIVFGNHLFYKERQLVFTSLAPIHQPNAWSLKNVSGYQYIPANASGRKGLWKPGIRHR